MTDNLIEHVAIAAEREGADPRYDTAQASTPAAVDLHVTAGGGKPVSYRMSPATAAGLAERLRECLDTPAPRRTH